MSLVVIGLSHRTAPVEVRERFAFPEARVAVALQQLRESGLADEGVILSTCNRVELYASSALDAHIAAARLREFLARFHSQAEPPGDVLYTHTEAESLHHLFRVASGLDSMVLGETEILGQLKKAYDLALQSGHTGAKLNKAFQRAFNVAKHIRTETNIQRGTVSVANVAVELAVRIFSSLHGTHVMVIGAGDTSEKTAKALLSRGAGSLIVTNRSLDRAQALAAELGGRAVAFADWAGEFTTLDIVISSTSATDYILDRARLAPLMIARRNRPLLLIDIAVPRDINPDVSSLDNVYLSDVDDLQSIAADYLKQRQQEIARCEEIIREKARALLSHGRPDAAGAGS